MPSVKAWPRPELANRTRPQTTYLFDPIEAFAPLDTGWAVVKVGLISHGPKGPKNRPESGGGSCPCRQPNLLSPPRVGRMARQSYPAILLSGAGKARPRFAEQDRDRDAIFRSRYGATGLDQAERLGPFLGRMRCAVQNRRGQVLGVVRGFAAIHPMHLAAERAAPPGTGASPVTSVPSGADVPHVAVRREARESHPALSLRLSISSSLGRRAATSIA